MFNKKSLLITGGTGSLGNAIVSQDVSHEIIIESIKTLQ